MHSVVAKMYSKSEFSVFEIMKKEKNVCWVCCHPQTANVRAPVPGKCFIKMEKAPGFIMSMYV